MPDNKNYIKDDYTIAFHASASADYQVIVASYSQESTDVFSGTSWSGSQGAAEGDFPRYTAFSSSFSSRWIQNFSGSDDYYLLSASENTNWDNAGTVGYHGADGLDGTANVQLAVTGIKNKFTRDGKLYSSRAAYSQYDVLPVGIVEYVSSSANKRWEINDYIAVGTASFSTVPAARQYHNYIGATANNGNLTSATGDVLAWDIVDVGEEKYLTVLSNRLIWKDRNDHSKGHWPSVNNVGGQFGVYGNINWNVLIYKSGSQDGWIQETTVDTRDLEAFQFAVDGGGNRINARHGDAVNHGRWHQEGGSNYWGSDADSPSGTGRSLKSYYYTGTDLLAYTASYDSKLRVAVLVTPTTNSIVNRWMIIHCSSSVGGWAVEDFVYVGKALYHMGRSQNGSFLYNQKKNEFYLGSNYGGSGGQYHRSMINIVASSSGQPAGVYYTPGTVEYSGRGGFLTSHQQPATTGLGSIWTDDIANGLQTVSKPIDRITLKELGMHDNLGAGWNNRDEWTLHTFFGLRMAIDGSGRLYVATFGDKRIHNSEEGGTYKKSMENKVFVLNNSASVYDPVSSSLGWYIEHTFSDQDYESGGKLGGRPNTWYDQQMSQTAVNTKYFYGLYGGSIAVPQFTENEDLLFVGAPQTIFGDPMQNQAAGLPYNEPRGCGYLYGSSSSDGWTLKQKFENPTNFLSSSATSPNPYGERDDAFQYENSICFTGMPNLNDQGGTVSIGASRVWQAVGGTQDNGFMSHQHGFSGSVLAIASMDRPQANSRETWYPFERTKVVTGIGGDYSLSSLSALLGTGSGGGQIVIYDGNAEYATETTTTREVGVKDGAVPGRVGNIRGAFNIRGQSAEGSYRVSIGDKKK